MLTRIEREERKNMKNPTMAEIMAHVPMSAESKIQFYKHIGLMYKAFSSQESLELRGQGCEVARGRKSVSMRALSNRCTSPPPRVHLRSFVTSSGSNSSSISSGNFVTPR